MKDFQKRVIDEKVDLDVKVNRLEVFMNGAQFFALDAVERRRLNLQLAHMKAYSGLLGDRIGAFKVAGHG